MDIDLKIRQLVDAKSVLEIGGLGDLRAYSREGFKLWRHSQIKNICASLHGIDINTEIIATAILRILIP